MSLQSVSSQLFCKWSAIQIITQLRGVLLKINAHLSCKAKKRTTLLTYCVVNIAGVNLVWEILMNNYSEKKIGSYFMFKV